MNSSCLLQFIKRFTLWPTDSSNPFTLKLCFSTSSHLWPKNKMAASHLLLQDETERKCVHYKNTKKMRRGFLFFCEVFEWMTFVSFMSTQCAAGSDGVVTRHLKKRSTLMTLQLTSLVTVWFFLFSWTMSEAWEEIFCSGWNVNVSLLPTEQFYSIKHDKSNQWTTLSSMKRPFHILKTTTKM